MSRPPEILRNEFSGWLYDGKTADRKTCQAEARTGPDGKAHALRVSHMGEHVYGAFNMSCNRSGNPCITEGIGKKTTTRYNFRDLDRAGNTKTK